MKILFMCVANSARSQLAEGLARQILPPGTEIRSAGSHPATPNPFALVALREAGIDTTDLQSKSVDELPPEFVTSVDYVITLCAEEVCPVVLSSAQKIHWPLPDPAATGGTDEEKLTAFRATRDEIRRRLGDLSRKLGKSGIAAGPVRR